MAGKTLGEGKEKVSLPSAKTLFGPDAANLKSVDAQVGADLDISEALSFHYASIFGYIFIAKSFLTPWSTF